jgi:hypothetical protein
MEKKQDSINWLLEEINKQKAWADPSKLEPLFEQAKAMHKEEVQDAYRISPNNELWSNSGIDYYNETFGGSE